MDGYISTTLDAKIAVYFAQSSQEKHKGNEAVLLKIRMQNEEQKLYISLNREDYTCYLDEREILLQAGLPMKVISTEI